MKPFVSYALLAVLSWQAVRVVVRTVDVAWARRGRSYSERLFADTDARIRAQLGDDYEVYARILELVPEGDMILTQMRAAGASAGSTRRDLRQLDVVNRLRHLVNPARFLALGMPDPISVVEVLAQPGQGAWLLVFDGGAAPVDRRGWVREGDAPHCQFWRFRKE